MKNKVIFGLGVSGFSALKLLVSQGEKPYIINAGAPTTWKYYNEAKKLVGQDHLIDEKDGGTYFSGASEVILSPGIAREHPLLQNVEDRKIINEIELAARFISTPLWGVTGTNGKTTTVSFFDHLLNYMGIRCFAGGNIGKGLCELVSEGKHEDYDVIVLELSSFQLESLFETKLDFACILNFSSSHGERYLNVADYAKAKENIFSLLSEKGRGCLRSVDKMIFPSTKDLNQMTFISELDDEFHSSLNIPGKHNQENLQFVLEGIKTFYPEKLTSQEKLKKGISEFSGVSHRLEFVLEKSGLHIYNDAKSTNWDATLKALDTFAGKRVHLIVGGKSRGRGEDAEHFFQEHGDKISSLTCFGESGESIKKICGNSFPVSVFHILEESIESIVNQNFQGILLFSPAYPSFDQFQNYVDRGNHFKKLCDKYF